MVEIKKYQLVKGEKMIKTSSNRRLKSFGRFKGLVSFTRVLRDNISYDPRSYCRRQ